MAQSKKIFLVRHGETEFNRLGIVQGSGVDKELNELGRRQAEQFFRAYSSENFDHVYISALQRTRQSVQGFLELGVPYTVVPELNEISWGVFEGKEQVDTERKEYWRVVNSWKDGDYDAKIVGGESAREMQARQMKIIERVFKNEAENTILVCMHGRAMKSMLCTLLNQPLSTMETFEHSNLGLYLLEYTNGKFHVLKRNDRSHFEAGT